MTDPKQEIALECQRVQEELLRLTSERGNLKREFEQLTKSSHHLLQQIQEDTSYASERKLNNYEAEKRRIEEKLEALESDIREKDKRIALLDIKAGDYLLQVSTTSNSLYDSTEKVEIAVDGEDGKPETVGEGAKSDEGAQVGGDDEENEGEVEEPNEKPFPLSDTGEEDKRKSDEELPQQVENITVVVSQDAAEEIVQSAVLSNELVDEVIEEKKEEILIENDKNVDENIAVDSSDVVQITRENEIIESVNIAEETDNVKVVPSAEKVIHEDENKSPSSDVADALPSATSAAPPSPSSPPHPPAPPASLPLTTDGTAGRDITGKQPSVGSPVGDQVMSLSSLVAELRRVKDDMGKCMTVKEHSFIELEDQLQVANKEVAGLKDSMARLSKDLEEKDQGYQALESENLKKKMDIELKMTEVQEVTNKCSMLGEEKIDLLRKLEVLEIMMTEYRTEIEMLIAEKTEMEQQTKQLMAARTTTSTAEAEIDSRTSVEEKEKEIEELVEKIQSMEQQMKELNDKLKVTNRHLKVMAREREYKQKECEILKRKVEVVELKMCELQGTFDMLVKAVMKERDDVIKEMEEKTKGIDDLQQTLVRLKDTHEQELEVVLYEKKLIQDELDEYKSGTLQSTADKEELTHVTQQKEQLEVDVKLKAEENQLLEQKVKTIQSDMNDFVSTLKDEMARLREESEKTKEDKSKLSEVFSSLQAEHLEMEAKHKATEKSFQDLQKANQEKTDSLEALQTQLEDLQRQQEELNERNSKLAKDIASKEEEYREELTARERTIQELNVTLTNNQKQSMENYTALQEDMSVLQAKFKNAVEEHRRQTKEAEDRWKQLEEEKSKEVQGLEEKVKTLEEKMSQKSTPPADASHSLSAEGECREAKDKQKEIESLNQKVKELTVTLETSQNSTSKEKPEEGAAAEIDTNALKQKIKDLKKELETLKGKSQEEGESGPFKSDEEFRAVIAKKEEKIKTLGSKVTDLENCLDNKSGYIAELEGKLKGGPSEQQNSSTEAHLQQISKLSTDITKLKEELEQTNQECSSLKSTVSQLETDKRSIEDERAKLVQEYETRLQQANGSLDEASANLEQKKNLVERLELELSNISRSRVDEIARLDSNHIGRVAEIIKLHKNKVEELKASNAAKISELLRHIEDICKEKKAVEDELKNLTLTNEETSKTEGTLMQERDILQSKICSLEKTVVLLTKEKNTIEEEKKSLKINFEEEQTMAMEMQTQMVSDLEKLILNLESERNNLRNEIEKLNSSNNLQGVTILESEKKHAILEDQIIIMAKEKDILVEEIKKLKEIIGEETVIRINEDHQKIRTIEELTTKVTQLENSLENSQASLEEQEEIYARKLREEKDSHLTQLTTLRNELGVEVDVMEEEREQVELEYEDRISLAIVQYQEQLSAITNKYEAQLLEEKAEFGRVLIDKIDEYEAKMSAQAAKLASCETQMDALQSEVDEKAKTIEELECNLDDMILMRAALKAQLDDLKMTLTKMGSSNVGASNAVSERDSCLDLLHAEYEARLTEMQEQYEAQLSYLRSLLEGTDYDARATGCSSPSQDSEYSIELSCLRPYLQGQSSPIVDFMTEFRSQSVTEPPIVDLMAELRSKSVQETHTLVTEDSLVHASSVSCYFLTKSSSGDKNKDTSSSMNGKLDVNLSSLRARLRTKAMSKAKAKCRSNGSIPHLVLNSASKSELKLLKSSLRNSELQISSSMYQTQELTPQQAQQLTTTRLPNMGLEIPEESLAVRLGLPPPITTGAKPRPPHRSSTKPSKLLSSVDKCGNVSPHPATTTTPTTTTQPSDPTTATTTALDKYRIKVELSACCVVQ
ncbi:hypothetical protein Pmani_021040 [Petrolisthes manimaculis]|uniref:Uncharacterized protein n=1 Tax=Petrolisthes manimaculis TaxID=1843537 RepID=A0AAE1U5W1_9EUCA|nr:hypothetical protein Pmani_021040 [Petrolisthes manimaculis]